MVMTKRSRALRLMSEPPLLQTALQGPCSGTNRRYSFYWYAKVAFAVSAKSLRAKTNDNRQLWPGCRITSGSNKQNKEKKKKHKK